MHQGFIWETNNHDWTVVMEMNANALSPALVQGCSKGKLDTETEWSFAEPCSASSSSLFTFKE